MHRKLSEIMEKNGKKRMGSINSDVVVFAFFLLLSFTLWYLNDLGKEAEAEIRYAVGFVNIPKGRVLADETPRRISLSVKGPGYSILKLRFPGKKTQLTIDLSKVTYKRVPESKVLDYYILTSGLAKGFTVQLRSGCDIVSVKPDTLFISLGKAETKPIGSR